MRRREFITALLGGLSSAYPVLAQQSGRARRIGVLANVAERDPVGQARLNGFVQRLKEFGWIKGQNGNFDVRWAAGQADLYRRYATELVALSPDMLLAFTSAAVAALQRTTRVIPIVFGGVVDPVGAGFVRSLAHPAGNATGFSLFEYSIAGKWLGLLKEIAPSVTRVAVLRESSIAAGIGQFAAIQTIASNSIELSVFDVESTNAVQESIAAFADEPNGGLVVTASGFGANHPEAIPKLALRYKLPVVYPFHYFVDAGGLLSYGPNLINDFRSAAEYADRILKGEKPADMPVQAPTKYQLVINLKTAKTLGLTVPPTLLASADEVIE